MNTALPVKNISSPEVSHRTDAQVVTDISRRLHAAAALIPSGPPLGQWVFKLVVSELRGQDVPAVEAVERATHAIRETDPEFEPRYHPRLLEL